jgi:kynurenine formamidase
LNARIRLGKSEFRIDLARPISLAIEISFLGDEPRCFGAPRASSQAMAVEGFTGSVSSGAGCNCRTITLTPHCNGTHTECAGHLTRDLLEAHRVIPPGLVPAALVSVTPELASDLAETTDPAPQPGDRVVTRRSLEKAWPANAPADPRAVIIRTLPNEMKKRRHDYSGEVPPYLTRDAVELLVERKIEHLIVDLPSIDRSQDEGKLTAHRTFFGMPPGARELAKVTRQQCTITELAYIPDTAADGWYLVEIQAPALGGDAVPSRPLLYTLRPP